jgi:hypothetical protein
MLWPMGLIGLLLLLVGFLGTVLSYVNIAIHAYREHHPLWGLGCLLIPKLNLVWGLVHWSDEDSRRLFLRYLAYFGVFVVGFFLARG